MPSVWIPALMRDLTGQQETIPVVGVSLLEVIDELDAKFPGIKARLCQGHQLRPGLAAVVDGQVARGELTDALHPDSEVHFIPAIGGG